MNVLPESESVDQFDILVEPFAVFFTVFPKVFREGLNIRIHEMYLKNFFCEKRNAFTPLGIEPRTFRLSVECSII